MAPHSSTLAWKIPWTEEPGRLQSMRLLRVGHDWATSLWLFTFMHWRRKWQPNPVFLPGESQGQGSLVGCHLWGCTESDMTEATWQQHLSHWKKSVCGSIFLWNTQGISKEEHHPSKTGKSPCCQSNSVFSLCYFLLNGEWKEDWFNHWTNDRSPSRGP